MSLIKCPECGRNVSDVVKCCIHCGYPIQESGNNICLIDGKEYDLTFIKNKLCAVDPHENVMVIDIGRELAYLVGSISVSAGQELANIIFKTGEVPQTYDGSHLTISNPISNPKHEAPVRCPKCSSTQITTGARGYSMMWGFMGAGKTVNRCARCGNTWKPRG